MAIYAVVSLSAIGAVVHDFVSTQRQDARSLVIAQGASRTDVHVRVASDVWRERRVHLEWVSPVADGADSVHPPGMASLPEPGWAVVSPAFERLAREDPALGRAFPRRTLLDDQGLAAVDELVAYARPPEGRGLGGEADAMRWINGRVVGDRVTVRVESFGAANGLPVFADEPRPWWQVPALALTLGLLPALGVAAVAARWTRTSSPRATIATSLGGTLLGAVAWSICIASSSTVPFTAVAVVAEPLLHVAALATLGLLSAVLVPTMIIVAGHREPSLRRPRLGLTPAAANLRYAPFALAGVILLARAFIPGQNDPMLVVGTVAATVGVWTGLPVVTQRLGQYLSRASSARARVLGARFDAAPVEFASPFLGLGLVCVVLFTFVPQAPELGIEPARGADGEPISVVTVEWLDVETDDVSRLQAGLEDGSVVAYQWDDRESGTHSHEHGGEPGSLAVGTTCTALASSIGGSCVSDRALGPSSEKALIAALEPLLGRRISELTFADRRSVATSGTAVVIARGDLEATDAAVRSAARLLLPGALVDSAQFLATRESDLSSAVLPGLLVLLVCLVLLLALDGVIVRLPSVLRRATDDELGVATLPTLFAVGWCMAAVFGLAVGLLLRLQYPPAGRQEAMWRGFEWVAELTGVGLLAGVLVTFLVAVGPMGGSRVGRPRPVST